MGWKLGGDGHNYLGHPTLNRTIVGWKRAEAELGQEHAQALNRTIVGWKRANGRVLLVADPVTALNRTIVGWKRGRTAVCRTSTTAPLNRTIVGWKRKPHPEPDG